MLIFELDHSQAHERFSADEYSTTHFNYRPGGNVPIVRNVITSTESIGSCAHDEVVKEVDEMIHYHTSTEDPPKGKNDEPKHDTLGP